MDPDSDSELNRYSYNVRRSDVWIDPDIRTAMVIAANDVVTSLCELGDSIESALEEIKCESGDIQSSLFSHLINDSSTLASFRIAVFKLLTAIFAEQSINRFCYFELPRETAETLEKLQPTEKFVVAAGFLKRTDVKSSHIYEGLKHLMVWRNQFAHGHNPGRSMKSLHKNHAVFPAVEELTTLTDELTSVRKAANAYRGLAIWLKEHSHHSISADGDSRELSLFTAKLECFSVAKALFLPDSEGSQYIYEKLNIDFDKLKPLQSE